MQVVTLSDALAETAKLADWLDSLGNSSLRSTIDETIIVIPDTHRMAQILRVLLPAQGAA